LLPQPRGKLIPVVLVMISSLLTSTLVGAALGQGPWPFDIYTENPITTVKGCKCKDVGCTTEVLFECNAAPFCEVVDKNCAHGTADYSLSHGYYDYCVYEPYEAYEKMSASKKKDLVMAHVLSDRNSGTYPAGLSVLTGIMGESVRVSFDASADVFPQRRTKYIHSVGVTGGIKFVSKGDHTYGGLFQGADYGIVRFSSARQPDNTSGVAPGMGVKFFRDGRPSANFVSMFSLDGQPCSDKNFFAHDWSNHIANTDNFGLKLIAAKFWQASYCPLMVGLSDLASENDGSQGVFPFQLSFHALVDVDCPCQDYTSCLANLASVPVGTKIFEVSAHSAPGDTNPTMMGHVVLTDPLVTSRFGDEDLFFRHQHMEDDYSIHPEWLESIDRKKQCGMGCTGTRAPPISKGCSSPFNSTEMIQIAEKMRSDDALSV